MDATDKNTIATDSLSCRICRRRKVKCDKQHPCFNCQKSNVECVFPQGRRRPTHVRTSRDTELLDRLKHLESELHVLRATVANKPGDEQNKGSSPTNSQRSVPEDSPGPSPDNDVKVEAITADFGRLDILKGRSRYTSHALWASLSQDVSC